MSYSVKTTRGHWSALREQARKQEQLKMRVGECTRKTDSSPTFVAPAAFKRVLVGSEVLLHLRRKFGTVRSSQIDQKWSQICLHHSADFVFITVLTFPHKRKTQTTICYMSGTPFREASTR